MRSHAHHTATIDSNKLLLQTGSKTYHGDVKNSQTNHKKTRSEYLIVPIMSH